MMMSDEASGSSIDGSEAHSPKSPARDNVYPPHGLVKSFDNYREIGVIGTGAYGTVYKGKDLLKPGSVVALKKVRIPLTENGIPLTTLREITLLKSLESFQHPNVVRLLDVCHVQQSESGKLLLYLVFEHCEQDLASYMEKAKPSGIPPDKIWKMSKEILNGIDFLHSQRIIHRDLKPQNLLVTASGCIKLADFGLAKTYDTDMKLTTVVVTLWYRPPEVLLGQPYHSAVDIWSAGAVLFEMHSLAPLFPGQSESDQLDKIFRVIGRPQVWPENTLSLKNFRAYPPKDLSDVCPRIDLDAKNLIQKMLSFRPEDRPSAAKCLEHPYITQDTDDNL